MENHDTTFNALLWRQVEARSGPIGALGRAAHADAVAGFAADGVPVSPASAVIAERISAARAVVAAGLDAYEGLVAAIEFAGEHADGVAPDVCLPHLLTLKVRLARLYHYIATVAPEADVEVAPATETALHVAESEAELDAWIAQQDAD